MRFRAACAAAFILLFLVSCGTSVTTEDLVRCGELYSSRISFGWHNTHVFQMRGNARLQGESLVARGPFVLWGDSRNPRLRGDFFGPDGKPVLSLSADTSGVTLYMPQDEYAAFMPGGLQTGSGTLRTEDLLFLIRTGFPLVMDPWMITEGADTYNGSLRWTFILPDSSDTMNLTMNHGDLFPGHCRWESGSLEITAASPHDEYRAWPWAWLVSIDDNLVSLELTEINLEEIPFEGIWNMVVPVPVDTMLSTCFWTESWLIPTR